ncbi:MAG: hypothetical protein CR984_04740 [Proteobacteria bacterium]|nr:MAG: hypothetical protein CR984_04740 [Pseudomonadota bacterium]PIE67326.1 MAG: hypothetical protein CSA23_04375 [Deltaproteobacteria bacterium]
MGFRSLKTKIRSLLKAKDFSASLEKLRELPGRRAVNPLFSLFYSGDELVRWRAIAAMGVVVNQLADTSMESARVVMRRLMWNLNDESGGIGWGSPEAMGEIAARHTRLAGEFANIIISYINPKGNFLEHERLQRGSLWAVGRLAHARPALAQAAAEFLPDFCTASDPYLRGTAIWAAGAVLNDTLIPMIQAHRTDDAPLTIYRYQKIHPTTVGELARQALKPG